MKFNEYLQTSWSQHTLDSKKIAAEFKENFKLMETEDDVMSMARLIVHVCGEHLGDWEHGITLLKKLKNNATIKDKNEMNRNVAILNLGNFPDTKLDNFNFSDQSIIYAQTASALANLGGIKNADKFYRLACQLAEESLNKEDGAIKTLAMSGNNIAANLENKKHRNEKENELMLFSAKKARVFWEMCGTWLEIERAEYRLSKTQLQLENFEQALIHADNCLNIIIENKAAPLEAFFAYELKCLIFHAQKNKDAFTRSLDLMKLEYDSLTNDELEWCRDVMNITQNLA